MSTGLTNTNTTHGFSDLYHVFTRKQCILYPALRHRLPYITLCYIDLRFFLPQEQSSTALLAPASQPHKGAQWQWWQWQWQWQWCSVLSHHNNYGNFILYIIARKVARCPLMVSIKEQIRCTLKLMTILLQSYCNTNLRYLLSVYHVFTQTSPL